MAFDKNNLIRTENGGSTGPGRDAIISEWLFATNDAKATVLAAGYFNGAASYVNKGDIIDASVNRSGTPAGISLIVTAVTTTTVTVALFDAT